MLVGGKECLVGDVAILDARQTVAGRTDRFVVEGRESLGRVVAEDKATPAAAGMVVSRG